MTGAGRGMPSARQDEKGIQRVDSAEVRFAGSAVNLANGREAPGSGTIREFRGRRGI